MPVYRLCAWPLDSMELDLQMVVSYHTGAGRSNLGPLEEQLLLLTSELSLQP